MSKRNLNIAAVVHMTDGAFIPNFDPTVSATAAELAAIEASLADMTIDHTAEEIPFVLEELPEITDQTVTSTETPATPAVEEAPKKRGRPRKLDANGNPVVREGKAPKAPVQLITAPGELGDMISSVDDAESTAMIATIEEQIKAREEFEIAKAPENGSIHRTIKKIKASLARAHAAKLLVATKVDPNFMNRALMDGSKYNVYAILKFSDLVDALVGGKPENAINLAIVRSIFKCKDAGITFTGEVAKACASDKIRIGADVSKHLVRHTVSESTAPTQASSTMQALATLGVVAVEGSRKNPTYKLNDTPIVRRLAEIAATLNGSNTSAIEGDEEAVAA